MSRSLKLATLLLVGAVGVAGLATARDVKQSATKETAKEAVKATPAAKPHHDIGREATAAEIAGWAISIRPDGQGLPVGRGTPRKGEQLFVTLCASCHGEFGESAGRWPILAGGIGTLASHDPVKSIGSYWPYASTLIDYVQRAMPFGNAQSLQGDELYSIVAYVLYINDVITDQDFELSNTNFKTVKLSNEVNFFDDDRETSEKAFWNKNPCMANCVPGEPKILNRARSIDVTPEDGGRPKTE